MRSSGARKRHCAPRQTRRSRRVMTRATSLARRPFVTARSSAVARRATRAGAANASNALSSTPTSWTFDGARATAPDGSVIAYVSRPDVKFIYDEVYARGCYDFACASDGEGDGVDVVVGAAARVVIDVGANIGLSSVKFARALGDDERAVVVALEPIPRTFDALRENVLRLVYDEDDASLQSTSTTSSSLANTSPIGGGPGTARARVYAHNVGVGSRSGANIEFTHFPRAAGWSTSSATRDDDETAKNTERFVFEALRTDAMSTDDSSSVGLEDNAVTFIGRAVRGLILDGDARETSTTMRRVASAIAEFVLRRVIRLVVFFMLSGAHVVTRPVVTVSDVIDAHCVDDAVVDLLKIDVERAELDVLRGITPEHWPRIRKVTLECHDIDGALDATVDLLRSTAGFERVVVDQPPTLRGGTLFNIYASRT